LVQKNKPLSYNTIKNYPIILYGYVRSINHTMLFNYSNRTYTYKVEYCFMQVVMRMPNSSTTTTQVKVFLHSNACIYGGLRIVGSSLYITTKF